ncbi:hypothetical protein HMPREF9582_01359 [Cutibacterium acnes HL060PA1]|nr:hypothetical protein HMPREF9577_01826 [Cutibacterium acnes HL110PA3]EFT64909.1 hypothetical protein HMPREF9582_01359 [Cutibacterium acnes HL060PA1]
MTLRLCLGSSSLRQICERDFHTALVLVGKGLTRPIPEWN